MNFLENAIYSLATNVRICHSWSSWQLRQGFERLGNWRLALLEGTRLREVAFEPSVKQGHHIYWTGERLHVETDSHLSWKIQGPNIYFTLQDVWILSWDCLIKILRKKASYCVTTGLKYMNESQLVVHVLSFRLQWSRQICIDFVGTCLKAELRQSPTAYPEASVLCWGVSCASGMLCSHTCKITCSSKPFHVNIWSSEKWQSQLAETWQQLPNSLRHLASNQLVP